MISASEGSPLYELYMHVPKWAAPKGVGFSRFAQKQGRKIADFDLHWGKNFVKYPFHRVFNFAAACWVPSQKKSTAVTGGFAGLSARSGRFRLDRPLLSLRNPQLTAQNLQLDNSLKWFNSSISKCFRTYKKMKSYI